MDSSFRWNDGIRIGVWEADGMRFDNSAVKACPPAHEAR
jgi:hypothetical protein